MKDLELSNRITNGWLLWLVVLGGLLVCLDVLGIFHEVTFTLHPITESRLILGAWIKLRLILIYVLSSIVPFKWLTRVIFLWLTSYVVQGIVQFGFRLMTQSWIVSLIVLINLVTLLVGTYLLTTISLKVIANTKFVARQHYLVRWWFTIGTVSRPFWGFLLVCWVLNYGTFVLFMKPVGF